MRSIEMALAVDFARRGAALIGVSLLAMIGLPLWVYSALDREGSITLESREAVILHVTLTLCIGFGASIAVLMAHGKLARFFIRPISSTRLVVCQMTLGMATIALMYLCTAGLLNLGGAGWPLAGPALFLATALACALAAIWTFEGTMFGQLVACTTTSMLLTIWFSRCYGARWIGNWETMWRQPTVMEVLTLAAISAAAYVVAIIGVARTRRGELWDFAALKAWWERVLARGSATRFASPRAAQAWCEWRQKLGALPAWMMCGFMLLPPALCIAGQTDVATMLDVEFTMPLLALVMILPLVFGMTLGACGHTGGFSGKGMQQTLATLPVTDGFLAQAMLRNGARVLAGAWGTWLAGIVILGALTYLLGFREQAVQRLPASFVEALPFLLLPIISWTFTALMMSVVATGRPWLWAVVLMGGFATGIAIVLVRASVTETVREVLEMVWFASSGALAIAGTVWAFAAAARRNLISSRTVLRVVAVWIAACLVAVLTTWRGMPPRDLTLACHLIGLLALAVAPWAALPLAIRWNRHR